MKEMTDTVTTVEGETDLDRGAVGKTEVGVVAKATRTTREDMGTRIRRLRSGALLLRELQSVALLGIKQRRRVLLVLRLELLLEVSLQEKLRRRFTKGKVGTRVEEERKISLTGAKVDDLV